LVLLALTRARRASISARTDGCAPKKQSMDCNERTSIEKMGLRDPSSRRGRRRQAAQQPAARTEVVTVTPHI
jgi:hypothetical protein